MRRLAAGARQLDLFGSALVIRREDGSQITDEGLQFLTSLEASVAPSPTGNQSREAVDFGGDIGAMPMTPAPGPRLVVDNTRTPPDRADPTKLSA